MDETSRKAYEQLKGCSVYVALNNALVTLELMPPNGANVHKRANDRAALRTTINVVLTEGSQHETFEQLVARDPYRCELIVNHIEKMRKFYRICI